MAARIYICDKCGFIFKRTGECNQCPDCGKNFVREASSDEKIEFEKRQREYNSVNK